VSRLAPLFSWQRLLTSSASDASRTERHVGLQVSLYMSASGDGAWPGNARLAVETGLGKSTVREALRGLDEKGWLIRSINRGRGNSNTYEARVPLAYYERLDESEKRQILAVFGLDKLAGETSEAGAASDAPGASDDDSGDVAADGEKRQEVALLKTGRDGEKRQPGTGKPPGDRAKTASGLAPTRTRTRTGPNAAAAAASEELANGFAADALAELEQRLAELRAGRTLTAAARRDPQRALAWIELAASEANRNPSGFVLAGLESGEWPGVRGPASSSTRNLQKWVDETAVQLGRESAHTVLDDWDLELDDGERAHWHQAIDEACDLHERDDARREVA
jgi:hypothetical protein